MKLRKPTEEEKKELLEHVIASKYIKEPSAEERQDEADVIDNSAYIAVFDDYITDGPGYAGKVMVVVWSGAPEFTETYYWPRPILPEDEDKLLGEIDWRDGKHEPRIEKVFIEEMLILTDEAIDKKIDAMMDDFQTEIFDAYKAKSGTLAVMARMHLRAKIIQLKLQSRQKEKAA